MSITLVELNEKLCELEETILVEKLNLSSEDIVNRCQDLIEDRYEELLLEFTIDFDEDSFNEEVWKRENL